MPSERGYGAELRSLLLSNVICGLSVYLPGHWAAGLAGGGVSLQDTLVAALLEWFVVDHRLLGSEAGRNRAGGLDVAFV